MVRLLDLREALDNVDGGRRAGGAPRARLPPRGGVGGGRGRVGLAAITLEGKPLLLVLYATYADTVQ